MGRGGGINILVGVFPSTLKTRGLYIIERAQSKGGGGVLETDITRKGLRN